jgi:phosphoenolpyruvate-protein kinase (PTS system EI component)
VSWIERVHVEAERSRVAIADSYDRLHALAAGDFGKETVVQSYARFVQAIDAAEQQQKRFKESVEPMQTAAKPVFDQWAKDMNSIGNERLRQRSQLRMAVTKERYDAIVASAVPSMQKFDAYVKALRDHATFLAHDLNPSALDDIQDEVRVVARSAQELDQGMDMCLSAARAYVESSALPAAPPEPAAPAGR